MDHTLISIGFMRQVVASFIGIFLGFLIQRIFFGFKVTLKEYYFNKYIPIWIFFFSMTYFINNIIISLVVLMIASFICAWKIICKYYQQEDHN